MVDAANVPPTTDPTIPTLPKDKTNGTAMTLARAFVLDANSEWITLATGHCICELSEDGSLFNMSLHDEIDSKLVLFSTTFHKEQEITRQQGTLPQRKYFLLLIIE